MTAGGAGTCSSSGDLDSTGNPAVGRGAYSFSTHSLLLQDLYRLSSRFCAKDCGVCASCLTKPQFGGQDPGAKCPYRGAKWRLPGKAPKKPKVMACGVKGKAKKVMFFSILLRTSSPSRSSSCLLGAGVPPPAEAGASLPELDAVSEHGDPS